jgi:hypothetical protein
MENTNNIKRTQTWNQIKELISKLNIQPTIDNSDNPHVNSISTEIESLFQIYLKYHIEKFSHFIHYEYNATDIPPQVIQEYLDENL